MTLSSSLESFRLCLDILKESAVTTESQRFLNRSRKNYVEKKIQWEMIKDVILDLACDAELGFLSPREIGLYEKLSSAYAETLLPTSKNETVPPTKYALDQDQLSLFHSLLEDKLQKKIDGLKIQNRSLLDLDTTLLERNDALLDLMRSQKIFAETVSQICTLTSELFREVRSHAQAKANLLVSSVLSAEAEGLKTQATELYHSVFEAARRNDAIVTHLRHIKEDLLNTSLKLENEVENMERLLRTYQNNDSDYHDLVRRYGKCQRDLTLRLNLLRNVRTSTYSCTPTCNSSFRVRRSLSAESLSIAKTTSYSFQ